MLGVHKGPIKSEGHNRPKRKSEHIVVLRVTESLEYRNEYKERSQYTDGDTYHFRGQQCCPTLNLSSASCEYLRTW